jgi:hypothetical protein
VIESRYRQLTIVNYNETFIDVLYEVTTDSMDMKSVSTALATATTSGEFTTSLQSDLAAEGLSDIQASANFSPMVVDVSPTSEPTYAPSRAPIVGTYAPTPLPTLELTQVNDDIETFMMCLRFHGTALHFAILLSPQLC